MEDVWLESDFQPPNVFYAVNAKTGDKFLIIEDDSSIYRLINKAGQIYVVAGFRCEKIIVRDFLNGTPFYSIRDPVLHTVMCSKIDSNRDRFVIDHLLRFL